MTLSVAPRRNPGTARTARAQHILMVEFASPDGHSWQAIGGGRTVHDAIAFAHESCPAGTTWQPLRWNDVYGD